GLRGCRLGLLFPEIYGMQVRAIIEAAVGVGAEGLPVEPEIMIPLVGHEEELRAARDHLCEVAQAVLAERNSTLGFRIGTMIEIPRACLIADRLAELAEFFSFGTNDLTQMTFGYSRDDAEGRFLQRYLEGIIVHGALRPILPRNPFEVLDREGVGELMRIAVRKAREVRPEIKLGVCGEHGG
ncbi:MAG: pyruvate, phosphate dikinase, partial [Lewinella sp.]|nr:pyruvate, phosphate dikinase [Lewinella sp.]